MVAHVRVKDYVKLYSKKADTLCWLPWILSRRPVSMSSLLRLVSRKSCVPVLTNEIQADDKSKASGKLSKRKNLGFTLGCFSYY